MKVWWWPFGNSDDRGLNATIFRIQNPNLPPSENFPEQKLGYVKVTDKSVGIACSGGGSRSHTLCAGYFRALRDLELDQKFCYISSVSGGSWATSIYVFAQEDDHILLGESTPPEKCSIKYMKITSPGKLGKVISKFFGVLTAIVQFVKGTRPCHLWQRMIGHTLLAPFELNKKTMALNEDHIEDIMKRNSSNKLIKSRNDFVMPKKGRPFIIINTCLQGPRFYSSGWGNSLQFTPLYAGVPFYRANKKMIYSKLTIWWSIQNVIKRLLGLINPLWLNQIYIEQMEEDQEPPGSLKKSIGGGAIETFAYGADTIFDKESNFGAKNAKVQMRYNELSFLEDAVGGSSAAFVSAFENNTIGVTVTPRSYYFPVLDHLNPVFNQVEPNLSLAVGDGGNYENTGLLPLLQRGLKKMICFINCATPLDLNFKNDFFTNEPTNENGKMLKSVQKSHEFNKNPYYCADTQLLSLFGAVNVIDLGYNYSMNQVFAKEKLNDVMNHLIESVKNGNGAITKEKLALLPNPVWNIRGGYEVEVMFVYNEHCTKFEERLPGDTKKALKDKSGAFGDFPFYRTMFQAKRPFALQLQEINLLAAQAEFVLKQNAAVLRELLK